MNAKIRQLLIDNRGAAIAAERSEAEFGGLGLSVAELTEDQVTRWLEIRDEVKAEVEATLTPADKMPKHIPLNLMVSDEPAGYVLVDSGQIELGDCGAVHVNIDTGGDGIYPVATAVDYGGNKYIVVPISDGGAASDLGVKLTSKETK